MKRKLDMDVKEYERHPNFTFRQEQQFYFNLICIFSNGYGNNIGDEC